MKMIEKKIYEHQNEIIEIIRKGIQIPSVKGEAKEGEPYGKYVNEMLEFALNLGKKWGMKTKNVDNKCGWVEIGEGKSMVAILGHLDVVPEGNGWDYEPYGAEIHNGILYGRGVADDKGPTLGAMYALKLIQELEIPLTKRIRVIFGMDEENGSSCIKHYVSSGEEIPEAGFTPDAEYPLIFFEKGIINLKVGKKKIEKVDQTVEKIVAGLARNIVPPKCTIVKKDGTLIEVLGKEAHGSTPWLGENAILNSLPLLDSMNLTEDLHQLIRFLAEKMEKEANGKNLGIYYHDEETGDTTVNLGMLTYNEECLEVDLDIRYPKNGDADFILKKVREAAESYGLEILKTERTEMLYVPQESEIVKKLMSVYRETVGEEQKALAIGGGTYAKMFPNMVAFGPVFPGMISNIHQANEQMSIEKLMQSIVISAKGIIALAQEEKI